MNRHLYISKYKCAYLFEYYYYVLYSENTVRFKENPNLHNQNIILVIILINFYSINYYD